MATLIIHMHLENDEKLCKLGQSFIDLSGVQAKKTEHVKEQIENTDTEPSSFAVFEDATLKYIAQAESLKPGAIKEHIPAIEPKSSVDERGVTFDHRFCGESKQPFYASGPRTGQWKKRRGVEEADYDAWHKSECFRCGRKSDEKEPLVDTAQAFNTAALNTNVEDEPPSTPGELIVWISEKQAAGILEQSDIDAVYAACGTTVNTLFEEQPAEQLTARILTLYNRLRLLIPKSV